MKPYSSKLDLTFKPTVAYMKVVSLIIGCTVLLFTVGCRHEPLPAQSAPGETKAVSDGGSTWFLGGATMNGTNVPLSNISVRAVTNQPSK